MIKVIRNEQVREIDRTTLTAQGIKSIDLMENAAKACSEWILKKFPSGIPYAVLCGNGNNGGDGMAIARQLWQQGKEVSVFLISDTGSPSLDFLVNKRRWEEVSHKEYLSFSNDLAKLPPTAVIIDALFGTGLNRPPSGEAEAVIKALNQTSHVVVSIDMPSGLMGDQHTEDLSNVIAASYTLSFQVPRPAFFYPEYEKQTGEWELLPIGLDQVAIDEAPAYGFIPQDQDIASLLPYRPAFGHKGTFGHALLLAGSYGKAGAAILSGSACLKSGAGLVTIRTPSRCIVPVQSAIPEAMCSPDAEEEYLSEIIKPGPYTALGIGPGIGQDKQTGNVLKRIFQDISAPLVLDADALNLLAENPTWLSFMPAGSILTPHPGEFSRLAGKIADPFERTKKQLALSIKYNCYILLKGKYTAISCPDGQLYFNPTGNHGMAKGGSGDVLTGLITGILAQQQSPMKAALCGAYIHGLAGDICAKTTHPVSMTARELPKYFDLAFQAIYPE